MRAAALLVALVLLVAAAPAAATDGTAETANAPRGFLGVVPQGPQQLEERDFRRMAAGDVGTVRLGVAWNQLEPAQGSYEWSRLDRVVALASDNGLRVMP